MKIKELLTLKALRPLPIVMLSDSMKTAEETLCLCETNCVYVADGCKVVGVLTQEDFIRLDVTPGSEKVRGEAVYRHMHTHVVSVSPETPLIESLKLMADYRARNLLVTEDDFPLTVLDIEDLIRALLERSDLDQIEASLDLLPGRRPSVLSILQHKWGNSFRA